MLNAQFAHVGKIRAVHCVGVWPRQSRAVLSKKVHPDGHIFLCVFGQQAPPFSELIGKLDFPGYRSIMYFITYIVKGITSGMRNALNGFCRLIRERVNLICAMLFADQSAFVQIRQWMGYLSCRRLTNR